MEWNAIDYKLANFNLLKFQPKLPELVLTLTSGLVITKDARITSCWAIGYCYVNSQGVAKT